MFKYISLLFVIPLLITCSTFSGSNTILVNNAQTLEQAINTALPGDEIVLANGIWKDIKIQFRGIGTKESPIILRAETPGMVSLEGQSYLKISGEYLVVDGLYFKNGFTPSSAVIEFRINKNKIANNCIVRNSVIEEYVQLNRYNSDHWVEFWGRNNSLDHCYIAGKFNQGPIVRINLSGNQHIKNYHQITNNHFGPRPRKGGPKAETIQIGDSYTSMTPSHVNISNNFFERCNGEVEVISSKTNFNEFRNNIFFKCEGSLVFRHGNYCLADGNFFIGDEKSSFNGGIRVINTGHWITNNYFYMIKGDEFRSSLAIMNGIPKSPLNRYNQVTDVVVAYNTWIDCLSPWQFSVGANNNKTDVLPASEIRSARPQRTIIANNIIYNSIADPKPLKEYDKVDGVTFKNNIIENQGGNFMKSAGLQASNLIMNKINDWLYIPHMENNILDSVYAGFGFDEIQKDIFGNSRKTKNNIGATIISSLNSDFKIDKNQYGAGWYTKKSAHNPEIITIANEKEIYEKIAMARDGDVLELDGGYYNMKQSLVINKKIIIRSKDSTNKASLNFSGNINSTAFEMNPKGHLVLENIHLQGNSNQNAFATLETNMFFGYNLLVYNSQINGFETILKVYKGSFADTISFTNTIFKNSVNGIELAAETDDLGDYNAEFLIIDNCSFENIQSNVINFYRGGYDESTIGGNLTIKNSSFKYCGNKEQDRILLKTRGIINVDISNNFFQNNAVKLIALLWGEKNNHHEGNKIDNSGIIQVDHYLKQKLVY